MLKTFQLPVPLRGDIRGVAGIEAWLAAGGRRVILGSAPAKSPSLVWESCRAFPGPVAVGSVARDGHATEGRIEETSVLAAHVLALRFERRRHGDRLRRYRSRRDVECRQGRTDRRASPITYHPNSGSWLIA